jgi:ribose-phosphate pyrophosphokinase
MSNRFKHYVSLNLADRASSELGYKETKFPDGQQSIEINELSTIDDVCPYKWFSVTIETRLTSFADVELLLCATAALKHMGVGNIDLEISYLIGARSDRRFNPFSEHYLKEVICPIINAQGYGSVQILDPHSDVVEALINNFTKISPSWVVGNAIGMISKTPDGSDIILVSPDAGASKKIYDSAKYNKIDRVITASKVRDSHTGKITHTEVPLSEAFNLYYHGEKFVICDDICDGGRTFIELAKAILDKVPNAELYLVVTHGIFSAGFEELSKYFKRIFTTNSYQEFEAEHEHVTSFIVI